MSLKPLSLSFMHAFGSDSNDWPHGPADVPKDRYPSGVELVRGNSQRSRGHKLPCQSPLASPDGMMGGMTAPAPVAPAPTMVAAACGAHASAFVVTLSLALALEYMI